MERAHFQKIDFLKSFLGIYKGEVLQRSAVKLMQYKLTCADPLNLRFKLIFEDALNRTFKPIFEDALLNLRSDLNR